MPSNKMDVGIWLFITLTITDLGLTIIYLFVIFCHPSGVDYRGEDHESSSVQEGVARSGYRTARR